MQVIALVSLLAQTLQPMLAYEIVGMSGAMFVRACGTLGAEAFSESFT